jgi:hypothetical protein
VNPILGTIGSHQLQKVTFDTAFSYRPTTIMSQIDLTGLEKLENRFIERARVLRIGAGQRLEVVFNVLYQGCSQVDLGRFVALS